MAAKCRVCKNQWIPDGDKVCGSCAHLPTDDRIIEGVLFKAAAAQVIEEQAPILEKLDDQDLEYLAKLESETRHFGSTGGTKHDQDKPMMALLPARALEQEAAVWTFGMKKYSAHNWLKGIAYLRILSAAMRHLVAMLRGEDYDPETGLLHAAHVRCCMGMLIEFIMAGRTDLDDRYKGT